TSNSLDRVAPSVLSVEPAGTDVSPSATIAMTFSKPVAGDWIDGFQVSDATFGVIAGSTRFSDDQRTLFFFPSQPLPAGGTISLKFFAVDDFAGNVLNTST